MQQYANDWVAQAKSSMRDWISRSFKQNLLNKGWFSSSGSAKTVVSSFLSLKKCKSINSL